MATTIRLSNEVELTTESPISHYGVPALRIDGVDYTDFGPGDIIPDCDAVQVRTGDDSLPLAVRAFSGLPAATLVINVAHRIDGLTDSDRVAIRAYLRQMPQLKLTDAQSRLLARAGISLTRMEG